jgi:hypothetical protein
LGTLMLWVDLGIFTTASMASCKSLKVLVVLWSTESLGGCWPRPVGVLSIWFVTVFMVESTIFN